MKPNWRFRKTLRAIITLLAASVLLNSIPAGAENYNISRITNTPYILDCLPQINDLGQIAWQGVDQPIQLV